MGNCKNAGRIWRPKGQPEAVNVHDFADQKLGKAAPYGVYDLTHNEGWFNLGISHDTATFAVASIRRWWAKLGHKHFPKARRLLITRRLRRVKWCSCPVVEGRIAEAGDRIEP